MQANNDIGFATGQKVEQRLGDLIETWARTTPDAVALSAPDREPLNYERLFELVNGVGASLNQHGLNQGDRIAIVLPNGPEMAVAVLAVAGAATSAPLNPAYRAEEFDFYLSDLDAKALIVQADTQSPATTVAAARGIPIIRLHPAYSAGAGSFELEFDQSSELQEARSSANMVPEDVALVLHTSGTTSRPKLVPLTQSNLCASACNVRNTLRLAPADRCLNIMPLFHIHGLVGVLFSSLSAGASVVCTPGFNAPHFFSLLAEYRPTWYSAVPTMHQSILLRADSCHDIIANHPLRLIRSSSASLPKNVMLQMEQVFGCPVIEAYGMTEGAHQIASNPLPPQPRKPGSVGLPAGPEVAICAPHSGEMLPAGSVGEIIIRGATVTSGYADNPKANAAAFTRGWFRTGDEGYLDENGYVFITGRLKEIINRGAEKISPAEIDNALMDHPAVAQAVTFAVAHAQLGEEIAAAVVLKKDARASEKDIIDYAVNRLADFKLPRRILIKDDLPKGPSGKIQRIGLADRLRVVEINGRLIELGRIDADLLEHDSIDQAFTVARRNTTGPSQLIAYLVANSPSGPDTDDLCSYLADRLPEYMIPTHFVVLDALPRHSDGSADLEKLPAVDEESVFPRQRQTSAPRSALEARLLEIWRKVLRVEEIGTRDNFFELGGDSLLAVQIFLEVEELLGKRLPISILFQSATIEEMANLLSQDDCSYGNNSLVAIQPKGTLPPLFCIHAREGEVLFYREFAELLGPDQPFYALRARGLDGTTAPHTSIPDMARDYISEIRSVQPEGPYFIGGHCYGGVIAFEVAQQLHADGHEVAFLGLIDVSSVRTNNSLPHLIGYALKAFFRNPLGFLDYAIRAELPYRIEQMRDGLSGIFQRGSPANAAAALEDPQRERVISALDAAYQAYVPGVYAGHVTYFMNSQRARLPHNKWSDLAAGGLEVHVFPGTPATTFQTPSLIALANSVRASLDVARTSRQAR